MSEPKVKQKPESRLSVTEVVYHFVPGQTPASLPSRVNRRLLSDEQPWVRRLQVGDQWQRLEAGWVERCSFLRVANEEGAELSKPQRAAAAEHLAARTVELGRGPTADAVEVEDEIPAGESVRRLPPSLKCLWLRCRTGRAAVTVVAVPE